ncbi:MAG: hypothetical protein HY819_24320 [Acidobacteria bacterium]|nr:hypothetical protein [Acidobacteriota bacterium]
MIDFSKIFDIAETLSFAIPEAGPFIAGGIEALKSWVLPLLEGESFEEKQIKDLIEVTNQAISDLTNPIENARVQFGLILDYLSNDEETFLKNGQQCDVFRRFDQDAGSDAQGSLLFTVSTIENALVAPGKPYKERQILLPLFILGGSIIINIFSQMMSLDVACSNPPITKESNSVWLGRLVRKSSEFALSVNQAVEDIQKDRLAQITSLEKTFVSKKGPGKGSFINVPAWKFQDNETGDGFIGESESGMEKDRNNYIQTVLNKLDDEGLKDAKERADFWEKTSIAWGRLL